MEGENVGLAAELERFARQRGADLFGIADLGPARELISSQGPSLVNGFPRAVSMGKQLCDIIVDHHDPNEPRRQSLYWHHVYEVVTRSLDFLAYDAARWLSERGFPALPVPASTPYDFDRLEGIFSHKLAAHLSSPDGSIRPPGPLCVRIDRCTPGNRLCAGPSLRKMSPLRRCLPGKGLHRGRVSPRRRTGGSL
jgi:hypothetical protein